MFFSFYQQLYFPWMLIRIFTPDIAYDSFHMLDSDNTDLPHRLSEAVRLWLLLWKSWKKRRIFRRKNTISAEMTKTAVPQVAVWAAVRDSFRLQSHRPRSVNPAVTTTHQGKGCNPKHDWHNYYFEGEDSQFPVCVTFPLPLSKLLASVCKQVSDCRKLLVTKGVCITLCDCGEGVVPGSAAAEGWWRIE